MARTDTLTNFLTDVADAIRTKTGSSETIPAEDFDTEIENIPSGGGLDWSTIGYSGTPQSIIDGYNYALQVMNNWDPDKAALSYFYSDFNLMFMPFVELSSKQKNMTQMFSNCYSLISIPLIDTSEVVNMTQAFEYCRSLKSIPQLDTKSVQYMKRMFSNCNSLTTVPLLDTSSITGNTAFSLMFSNCNLLTDQSLDNILQMCINATSYTGTKSLSTLGILNYSVSKIQALPHYQDFIDAGWTIGY